MTATCAHCGAAVETAAVRFCCPGCEAANALLTELGLERYYELRGPAHGEGAVPRAAPRPEPWLDEACERLASGGTGALDLDVQGLHCAACVWVIEQLGMRQPGAVAVEVNPGAGTLRLVADGSFPLRVFRDEVARLGYRLGPRTRHDEETASRGLMLRMGVCAALAMNVMIFSLALYTGLTDGPVQRLMLGGSWALTAVAVVVGGTPFFRSAWASVRARTLHLDLPIALGIALAFAGSTASMLMQRGRASYFDTVATFVTLMLLGRFLQERVLERNRRALLGDEGIDRLLCHRLEGGRPRAVRVGTLGPGDLLQLRPGELLPVAATLREPARVEVSCEWITGESDAQPAAAGEALVAGSFLASDEAAVVEVREAFASSRLSQLLRRPRAIGADQARRTPLWQALARGYVSVTLLLALLSGVAWTRLAPGSGRALEVVVAILVVTCPCAFGIAVPVAIELAQAALRRQGVFVRSATLLERALGVEAIVFDKTGTLTLGDLEVVEPGGLRGLPERVRRAAYQMAVRSSHPRSRALVAALAKQGLDEPLEAGWQVREETGRGLELRCPEGVFRLGARGWAGAGEGDLVLGEEHDGAWSTWAALTTREVPRREAAQELRVLRKEGYDVRVLSGDVASRVATTAAALGLDAQHVRAEASPEDKRAYVEALGAGRVLMVGDGVNDAAAFGVARCSVTPVGDLPFVATRTDVYVQGPLVTGVRRMLQTARRLDRTVREAVGFGVAYNVLAVGAACAGWMTPLLAAVLMPLSSLGVVAWVVYRLRTGCARDENFAPGGEVTAAPVPGVA